MAVEPFTSFKPEDFEIEATSENDRYRTGRFRKLLEAQDRDDVVIEKSQGPSKKIHFLNMHPENSPLDTLDKVGEIIGLKRMPNS